MAESAGVHTPTFNQGGTGVLDTAANLPRLGGFGESTPANINPDALVKSLRDIVVTLEAMQPIIGSGFPRSGPSGTSAGVRAAPGIEYQDYKYGTKWINTGTLASPYWEMVGDPGVGRTWGMRLNPHIAGTAISDTGTSNVRADGWTALGDGIAEADSGVLELAATEGGRALRLTASATSGKLIAMAPAVVTNAGPWQADQHYHGIIDVEVAHDTAITARREFLGMVGLAAVGLVSPITGATVTATLVQDDLSLLHMDTGYTAADHYMVASNKSDAAATVAVTDTGVVKAAAGVFDRLRAEFNLDPADATKVIAEFYVNKVRVAVDTDALDENEEHNPVFGIVSLASATKIADIRNLVFVAGEKANG